MVFFVCNGCGSSLKKNAVEKHKCRNSGHLSCMDCSKDFYGEDYKSHVKCVSEEEKYSAKGWTPKPNQNKNEKKQSEWVAMVQGLVNSVSDPSLSRVLQTIGQHENIPRKKPKFLNFLKNIFGPRTSAGLADKAWDLISKALEEQRLKDAAEATANKVLKENENGIKRKTSVDDEEDAVMSAKKSKVEEDDQMKPKKKKKKNSEEEETVHVTKKKKKENSDEGDLVPNLNGNTEATETENLHGAKVKWSTIGKTILRASDGKELSLKKFQKKIIPEYLNRIGGNAGDESVEVLWSKCLKKLSKNPKFKIHKEQIKLVS